MGLFKNIFRGDRAGASGPESSQFEESAPAGAVSGNAPRRELVRVVLRETMRRHGVPADWIDSRILSVVSSRGRAGMHLHFVVRQGHELLLAYVPAFENSFMTELEKFEPQTDDWLLSLAWQFEGIRGKACAAMPESGPWMQAAATAPASAAATPSTGDEDVRQDLQALFAIRDAALNQDPLADHVDFQPTQPSR